MGWTTTYKPKSITAKDYILNHTGCFKWSDDCPNTYKVLDSAVVSFREFYAAVEMINKETGERRVWAAIFLLDYWPKSRSENFGWKDMDETCNPYFYRCPERILKLLTPTENAYAIEWREKCWKKINDNKARPKITEGCVVVLHGKEYKVMKRRCIGRGWTVMRISDCNTFKMSDAIGRKCTEVRPPEAT